MLLQYAIRLEKNLILALNEISIFIYLQIPANGDSWAQLRLYSRRQISESTFKKKPNLHAETDILLLQ